VILYIQSSVIYLCTADNSVQVGVTRLGTYGDVTVRWLTTQVDTDDASKLVPLGSIHPPSGSVTLVNGEETAVFSVEVMHPACDIWPFCFGADVFCFFYLFFTA